MLLHQSAVKILADFKYPSVDVVGMMQSQWLDENSADRIFEHSATTDIVRWVTGCLEDDETKNILAEVDPNDLQRWYKESGIRVVDVFQTFTSGEYFIILYTKAKCVMVTCIRLIDMKTVYGMSITRSVLENKKPMPQIEITNEEWFLV